jgi:uncharacterized protein (TIGR00290 family)
MKKRTLLSWSSGKDSAWALHVLRKDPEIDILGLFSVTNQTYGRVSMHAARLELVQHQAEAVGLPLQIISIPHPCSNDQCDAIMQTFIEESLAREIECMAFGDLFLEDVRKYRKNQLHGTGIVPIFPLWDIPTRALAEHMLSSGVEAYISSVDLKKAPADLAGRLWCKQLLTELPASIDPCGEHGEFHTIVVGGPFFRSPIGVHIGETVEREGFIFADIIPTN